MLKESLHLLTHLRTQMVHFPVEISTHLSQVTESLHTQLYSRTCVYNVLRVNVVFGPGAVDYVNWDGAIGKFNC